MQTNGNLVLLTDDGKVLFHTGTSHAGAKLGIGSDCNLVIYSGSTPYWWKGPFC